MDSPLLAPLQDALGAALFQHADLAVFLTHPDGAILRANPAACRVLDMSEAEICRRGRAGVVADDEHLAAFRAARQPGGVATGVLTLRRGDGSTFPAECTEVRLGGTGAEPLGLVILRDSSGALRHAAQLRASEELLRLFVEHAPAALAMLDKDMRYLVVSRRWLQDYRLGSQDLRGRSHYEVFPDLPARWRQVHQRCLAGASESCAEDRFPRGDGTVDWVRWVARPWLDSQGQVGGLLLLTEVITGPKNAAEATQRLAAIVESSDDAIISKDLDGTVRSWNRGAQRLYGYRAEEMLGRPTTLLIPPGLQDEEERILGQLRAGQRVEPFETVRLAKDGRRVDVSVSASPIRAEDGRVIGASKIARDITGRRRVQERLEAAQRFAQSTLDAMAAHICVLDGQGKVVAVNAAWNRFAAANGALPDAVGEGADYLAVCARAVPPDTREAADFARRLQEVLAGTRERFTAEYVCHSPTERRWFSVTVTRFVDAGQVRAVVAHQDITTLKGVQQALANSEAQLRLALSASRQVEWQVDLQEGRVSLGPGGPSLVGGPDLLPSPPEAWRDRVHPEDFPVLATRLQDCLSGVTEDLDAEFRLRGPAGTWRWVHARGRVTRRDLRGQPQHLQGLLADVQEVHALREKLLAASRLASVGTLAAGVAHEVNNPLCWMGANLESALELLAAPDPAGTRGEALRTLLQEAQQGVERIASIVASLRSLVRPAPSSEVQPIDVRAELLGALQVVRNRLVQRATLDLRIPDALPLCRARSGELGRVFVNLLVNAADAIPEGSASPQGITVAARAEGGGIVVEVTDTGCGMSAPVRERIFDPFFTTKPLGQGTGLGLTTSRALVDAAGGRLEVESQAGQGSTFRVWLPAVAPIPPAPVPTLPAGERPRLRVLVIDDEPLVARGLQRLLSRYHAVDVLESAADALVRLERGERWDAILCDFMMSGLDGVGFHQALAARWPELLPRLAFVTGGVFGDRGAEFLAQHDVRVLAKPVEREPLLEVLDRLARAPSPPVPPASRAGG